MYFHPRNISIIPGKVLFIIVIIVFAQVRLVFAGLLVAQQSVSRPPLLVAQMTEEWLNYYRKIAQVLYTIFGQISKKKGHL